MAGNKFDEKPSVSKAIELFIIRHRSVFFVIIAALMAAAVAIGAVNYIGSRSRSRGIEGVEEIAYRVEKIASDAVKAAAAAVDKAAPPPPENAEGEALPDSPELAAAKEAAEADKNARITAAVDQALADLEAYTKDKGVIAVRANLLKAELLYRNKSYADAALSYLAAGDADPKAYTAPLAYENAAKACEEGADQKGAADYYEKAAAYEDYPFYTRVAFNLGRVKDEAGDFAGAAQIYTKLADEHTTDPWGTVAKSRLLQLQAEGKVG